MTLTLLKIMENQLLKLVAATGRKDAAAPAIQNH
jgi:hypothetical protein